MRTFHNKKNKTSHVTCYIFSPLYSFFRYRGSQGQINCLLISKALNSNFKWHAIPNKTLQWKRLSSCSKFSKPGDYCALYIHDLSNIYDWHTIMCKDLCNFTLSLNRTSSFTSRHELIKVCDNMLFYRLGCMFGIYMAHSVRHSLCLPLGPRRHFRADLL